MRMFFCFIMKLFRILLSKKMFVCCLNHTKPWSVQTLFLRRNFLKHKILSFLQAFLLSSRADVNFEEPCLRSAV